MTSLEVTRLTSLGGPLTKRISLVNGLLRSDGSACIMTSGIAQRVQLAGVADLAKLIRRLKPNEAIALGALRSDLPGRVTITTKDRLTRLNGNATPELIARTTRHFAYAHGEPAFALIDIDNKGMPRDVRARIDALGGYWSAIVSVVEELAEVARVIRPSTSAGLFRTDTQEQLQGSGGVHIFLQVANGADIDRFLRALHERCWLAGLGWLMVGAGGQLLERSTVDRMVGAPERLVFEAAPIVEPPLAQDRATRAPVVVEGGTLDTAAACPPLSIVERARLRVLHARESQRVAPDAKKARAAFIAEHSKRLVERTGTPGERVARIIASQCDGVLLPDVVLLFDDDDLAGTTVADVLADPVRFEGATLADPLEGVAYGTCKARIMRRADGTPWIHSFAHGRTIYLLKLDARAAEAALRKAPEEGVTETFVRVALAGELGDDEVETLRNIAALRTGIGKRAIDRKLKAAREEHKRQHAREERERRTAECADPRPQITVPAPDAPWLPQMQALNEVLGKCEKCEPPMRDIDGVVTVVRVRRMPNLHALTALGANDNETDESRLSAPEQPLLTRLTETELAELIERYIEYVDESGRPVHLPGPFVKHFHTRHDDALPIVATIVTLPMVLVDGTILSGDGLDRSRGIVFRVPDQLRVLLPRAEECTAVAVADAMRFLTDEWLVDVATDLSGKYLLIAAALTLIERSLLPDRPVFFVTAGRRGGGKTTTLIMLLMAITGVRPAAAAWSPNEEERRKALLAYLMEGLPAIVWDNIARGSQISCPHIERSCTTAFYSDRRLGVSELVAVAAAVVHLFTGNNIGPRGDMASRSLLVRLEVDRADPENRLFRHPDPILWTEMNRGRILQALYTILLGNPQLRTGTSGPAKTRFKIWWRLVGSAVEHAAGISGGSLDFQHLFLTQEEDDEESSSLTDALGALADKWPNNAKSLAADVARLVNDHSEFASEGERQRGTVLREFLFPTAAPNQIVTAKSVGKRLKRHVGEPVQRGHDTLLLRASQDPGEGSHGPHFYQVHVSLEKDGIEQQRRPAI
jgi:hypothetical protein